MTLKQTGCARPSLLHTGIAVIESLYDPEFAAMQGRKTDSGVSGQGADLEEIVAPTIPAAQHYTLFLLHPQQSPVVYIFYVVRSRSLNLKNDFRFCSFFFCAFDEFCRASGPSELLVLYY
jgi:hypothetical protein